MRTTWNTGVLSSRLLSSLKAALAAIHHLRPWPAFGALSTTSCIGSRPFSGTGSSMLSLNSTSVALREPRLSTSGAWPAVISLLNCGLRMPTMQWTAFMIPMLSERKYRRNRTLFLNISIEAADTALRWKLLATHQLVAYFRTKSAPFSFFGLPVRYACSSLLGYSLTFSCQALLPSALFVSPHVAIAPFPIFSPPPSALASYRPQAHLKLFSPDDLFRWLSGWAH